MREAIHKAQETFKLKRSSSLKIMRSSFVGFLLCAIVLEEVVLLSEAARLTCPSVSIKNGKVRRRRQRTRFITFDCKTGYSLAGGKHSSCVQGQWDPPPPLCIRATCMRNVTPPVNGLIYQSHGGAALHFFCNSQFVLRGPQHVYCDGDKWNNNAPICLPRAEKPELACDFEDENLCGWTHDLNHDFDWTRESFSTPSGSIGTGPSWDHTKGIGSDGHYMYIESTSRNENDTARLISPVYDRPDGDICFKFFYHMFGLTTGTLRVYLKRAKDSWNLKPEEAFFSLSGNQGNEWYRSFHALGDVNDEFQIVIEGVRGSGYTSDIAIDDVSIIQNCTGDKMETTTIDSSEMGYMEPVAVVDSCQNRCGTIEALVLATHITCDCDDDCYDRNRCCPDFFDICGAGTYSTDVPTTDLPNEIPIRGVTNARKLKGTTIFWTQRTTTTTARSTTKSTMTTSTTTRRPSTTNTIRTTPSTIKATTPSVKKFPPKPTIMLKTPPTTQRIALRTPSTTTTTTTRRPTTKKTQKPGREIENDVIDLPVPTKNDEGLLILTTSAPDDYLSKEYWSEEDTGFDKEYTRHINESVPLFSIKKADAGNYNVLLIIIGTAGVAILVSLIAFALFRRWRDPRSRISFGSSNGTSQSDVRFLSHDEMIDFSLPKDYEDL